MTKSPPHEPSDAPERIWLERETTNVLRSPVAMELTCRQTVRSVGPFQSDSKWVAYIRADLRPPAAAGDGELVLIDRIALDELRDLAASRVMVIPTRNPARREAIDNALKAADVALASRSLPPADWQMRLVDHLCEHWLTSVNCNHENHTNRASCSCSEIRGEEVNSVGAAVLDWAEHVVSTLAAPLPSTQRG